MKRIFVFILAAMLLVGVVPVKEVKAEEAADKYELVDVLKAYDFT